MNFKNLLTAEDFDLAHRYIGGAPGCFRWPDLIIAPGDVPYLYRWHVVPRNPEANVYFHIQVASDPDRPLHDHPWDCTSVILAGGYKEILRDSQYGRLQTLLRKPGDTIHRKAEASHRLILPDDVPYTMTLFTTGRHRREWGFWMPSHQGTPRFVHNQEFKEIVNGEQTM